MKKEEENKYYRAYMDSFEWNYFVLELIDFLEEKLFDDRVVEPADIDPLLNFKTFCESRQRNWKVIRKMIEYFVNTSFESEMELVKHEVFKPVKRRGSLSNKDSSAADIESILKGLSESL